MMMAILARKIGDSGWTLIFRGTKAECDRILLTPADPTLEFRIIDWEE